MLSNWFRNLFNSPKSTNSAFLALLLAVGISFVPVEPALKGTAITLLVGFAAKMFGKKDTLPPKP